VALVALCGWCFYRFFKKKRPKDKKKNKDGKLEHVSTYMVLRCMGKGNVIVKWSCGF
jgi:hypothetical protein